MSNSLDLGQLLEDVARRHDTTPARMTGPWKLRKLMKARRELGELARADGATYAAIASVLRRDVSTVQSMLNPRTRAELARPVLVPDAILPPGLRNVR